MLTLFRIVLLLVFTFIMAKAIQEGLWIEIGGAFATVAAMVLLVHLPDIISLIKSKKATS
jgi:hypothetical protein